jgi:cytoskeletal protein CcmA (bactofilin family)
MLNKGSIFSGNRESVAPGSGVGRVITSTNPTPSSSGSTASTASRAPESTPVTEPPGAKLVVGPGVKLKGAEIQDCDMLLVEGRVEATMDSRLIQIADQGSFDGTVNIDVAEIRGRFSGELTARSQLIIHSTGRVSGKIRYGKIVVHEGGELSGDVKSLTAAESANSPTSPKSAESVAAANVEDLTATAMNRLLAAKSA